MEETKQKLLEVLGRLQTLEEDDPRREIFLEQQVKLEEELKKWNGMINPGDNICESCQ